MMLLLIVIMVQKYLSQPVVLEPNTLCVHEKCSQSYHVGSGKQNLYKYGQSTFGDLSNTNFTVTIWLFIPAIASNQYFIMSMLDGASKITVSTDLSYIYANQKTDNTTAMPISKWVNVFFSSKTISGTLRQKVGWNHYFTSTKGQYTLQTPSIIPSNIAIEFLQDSQNIVAGYIHVACCIMIHLNDDDVEWDHLYLLGIMNQPKSFTLLHLRFLEKQQGKITQDWSEYQYIPKLGNNFAIQTNIDDPILDIATNSYKFESNKFIKIDNFKLTQSFSIELKFSNHQCSQAVTILKLTNSGSNQLSIVLDPIKALLIVGWQNVTMNLPLFQADTYFITIVFLQCTFTNELLFIGNQRNDTYMYNFTEQYVPKVNIIKYVTTLFIGSPDSIQFNLLDFMDAGSYIQVYEVKINRGFYFMGNPRFIPNCKYYLVNRCIQCNFNYKLTLDGLCVTSCDQNYLMIYSNKQNSCINQCHTTCQTCLIDTPVECLSCAGIRINPPKCACPRLYYDDGISPNCIKYIPDQSVQSEAFMYTCSVDGWVDHVVTFQSPYLSIPQVITALYGFQQSAKYQFDVNVMGTLITKTGFTYQFFCKNNTKIQLIWMAATSNNAEQTQPQKIISPLLTGEILQNTLQTMVQLPTIIGYFTSSTTSLLSVNFQKVDNIITRYSSEAIDIIYSDIFISKWQYQYGYNGTLNAKTQSSSLPTSGVLYSINVDQPFQIPYLIIIQGISQNQDKTNFITQVINRSSEKIQFSITESSTQQINQISVILVFASFNCTNNTGPCNYYESILSTCDSTKHTLCSCETIGYYQDSNNQCFGCDNTCMTCVNIATQCTSCNPTSKRQLIGTTCQCQLSQYVDFYEICQDCSLNCLTCVSQPNNCTSCHPDILLTLVNNKCLCQTGSYSTNPGQLENQQKCQLCNAKCATCIDSDTNCLTCNPVLQLVMIAGICQCASNYYINTQSVCSICDETCKKCFENPKNCLECIDPLKSPQNGVCHCKDGYYTNQINKCQECNTNCRTCESIDINCTGCLQGMFLDQFKCLDCHPTCLTCSGPKSTQCLSCKQNQKVSNGSCICIEGFYSDNLQECQKCHYSCEKCENVEKCTSCSVKKFRIDIIQENAYCLCSQGYYDEVNQQTCQKCNDKCQKCINSQSCVSCNKEQFRQIDNGKCVCQMDYFENNQLTCQSCKSKEGMLVDSCKYKDCFDGLWTKAEECDDGNNIPRDGCTDCLIDGNYKCVNVLLQPSFCYKCQANCIECELQNLQVICKQCVDGYFPLNEKECGKCSDNCRTCSSLSFCTGCKSLGNPNQVGKCSICEDKPGLYTIEGTCQSICGDSLLANNEECDDGNLLNDDGCDISCKIEKSSKCVDNICEKIPKPMMNLQFANITTTNSLVLITSQPEVQMNINQAQQAQQNISIQINIEQFEISDFNYTVNKTQKEETLEYIIDITYYKTIDELNLIHVILHLNDLQSPNRMLEEVREVVIKPRKQLYYSQGQVSQAQAAQGVQDALSYSVYFIGPAAVLLGGFAFFWTILDIMSWINNLYYINVYFPENVRLFFEKSAWGNISLIPTLIQVNKPDDAYYTPSPPRFMEKDVDPLFINNTWMCFSIWICAIGLYLLSKLTIRIIDAVNRKNSIRNLKNLPSNSVCQRSIHYIYQQAKQFQQNILSTMINVLNLSFLDLVIAVTLQLNECGTSKVEYIVMLLNFCAAFVGLLICCIIIRIAYRVSKYHKKILQRNSFQRSYGALYENINSSSRIAMLYSFVNLIRKALFIICVVLFYYQPITQTVICTLISLSNVALILYENPFVSKKYLLQYGVPDISIFILMLIFTGLALDDKIGQLNTDDRFLIGWVILGVIGISIGIQLVFLIEQFIHNIITNCKLLRSRLWSSGT